jgi:adenosylhomocysteine nucleosidase
MVIGIIGAMDEEIELLLPQLNLKKKLIKAQMTFSYGELLGKEVVLVRSGIGKVNAAICTQILIDDFDVTNIINVGIAGGIGEDIYPGDVVIADNLVQHDMDTSVFGDKIGQVPRLDCYEFNCDKDMVNIAKNACAKSKEIKTYIGRIVSGDQFVANIEKTKWLSGEFNALACEMEGASIAQVSYLNKIPFVVIRSISDNANNGAHMDYKKFSAIAVLNSTNFVKNMLTQM